MLIPALLATGLAVNGCTNEPVTLTAPAGTESLGVVIHQEVPHDPAAFTQGLELLDDGTLIESTGGHGTSTVRLVTPGREKPDKVALAPGERFGEGLTVVGDRVIQLTWKDNLAHVWDLNDLTLVDEIPYDAHGWGACYDDTTRQVWTSDGSADLVARSPDTLAESGRVTVTLDGEDVEDLNELECVDGQVWANVWHSNQVIHINPATGQVVQVVDLSSVVATAEAANGGRFGAEQVLNGIAYDDASGRWWVTGKEWPVMFQITITSQSRVHLFG